METAFYFAAKVGFANLGDFFCFFTPFCLAFWKMVLWIRSMSISPFSFSDEDLSSRGFAGPARNVAFADDYVPVLCRVLREPLCVKVYYCFDLLRGTVDFFTFEGSAPRFLNSSPVEPRTNGDFDISTPFFYFNSMCFSEKPLCTLLQDCPRCYY